MVPSFAENVAKHAAYQGTNFIHNAFPILPDTYYCWLKCDVLPNISTHMYSSGNRTPKPFNQEFMHGHIWSATCFQTYGPKCIFSGELICTALHNCVLNLHCIFLYSYLPGQNEWQLCDEVMQSCCYYRSTVTLPIEASLPWLPF